MASALHAQVEDDPSWLVVNSIAMTVLILAVVIAALLVIRHKQRRDYLRKWRTVQANVTRLDEHERFITGGGPLTDRVMVLEDQLAVERKYRSVLEGAVLAMFDAADQPVPEALVAQTSSPPKLTVIRGGVA